jgi:SNF2 family DNA or RNA helicase
VRKRELGQKPQVFIDPIKVEMKENERRLYNAILGKIRQCESEEQYLKDASSDLVTNLRKGRMMRLRQVLSYPKLLLTAIDNYSENILRDREDLEVLIQTYDQIEQPGKIDSLLSLVKKFNERSEKVVIWANFIGTINLIEDVLKKNGYYCKKIYGATPFTDELNRAEETREKIRDEFVDPRSGLDILIANPAACSESISLHKTCCNALYYDLSYNCAQYLQSLDRIHRVGGSEEKEAFYYFLQYANTIEPKLLITLNTKAQKMYQIIEGDYSIYSLDMYQDDELDVAIYSELFKK